MTEHLIRLILSQRSYQHIIDRRLQKNLFASSVYSAALRSRAAIMPMGLLSLLLLSTTTNCLTSCCNIISTAFEADAVESIVIIGDDIISPTVTALVRVSLMHAFLTISRSVTIP